MVLRTARRGPNAGRQFYGCSRYSQGCRGAKSISRDGAPAPSADHRVWHVPVKLSVDPARQTLQTKFFQACALPAQLVAAAVEADPDARRALSQWRLDYPRPRAASRSELVDTLISVAEAILTRGSTPYCSPELEQAFPSTPALTPHDLQWAIDGAPALADYELTSWEFGQDSPAESACYARLFALMRQHGVRWSVTPQIHLASLSPGIDPSHELHGDFLLTHPGNPPVLVEIDGEQYHPPGSDDMRDRLLAEAGVHVVRIHAAEVQAGGGPRFDQLIQTLVSVAPADAPAGDISRAHRNERLPRRSAVMHPVIRRRSATTTRRWLWPIRSSRSVSSSCRPAGCLFSSFTAISRRRGGVR